MYSYPLISSVIAGFLAVVDNTLVFDSDMFTRRLVLSPDVLSPLRSKRDQSSAIDCAAICLRESACVYYSKNETGCEVGTLGPGGSRVEDMQSDQHRTVMMRTSFSGEWERVTF